MTHMKIDETTNALRPWMKGPFELIRHADGHLKDNGDTDRRIALIGFDNAIEVSIDVFLRLHPKLRVGIELRRDEVEQAQRNYHTKIEFLDKHVQTRQIPLSIPVDEIVWFHQLRNELYHSGNGMVPEEHVISGAREAALAVFQALFGLDISGMLGAQKTKSEIKVQRPAIHTNNPEMDFLGWFIELENMLQAALPADNVRPSSMHQMWQLLIKNRADLVDLTPEIDHLSHVRNAIVHGRSLDVRQLGTLESRVESILRIMERLQSKSEPNPP